MRLILVPSIWVWRCWVYIDTSDELLINEFTTITWLVAPDLLKIGLLYYICEIISAYYFWMDRFQSQCLHTFPLHKNCIAVLSSVYFFYIYRVYNPVGYSCMTVSAGIWLCPGQWWVWFMYFYDLKQWQWQFEWHDCCLSDDCRGQAAII